MGKVKKALGIDVCTAAQDRISWIFDKFPRVCASFSAGKDSTVMVHLMADEARKRGRKFGLLFIDLEAQYQATIEHAERIYSDYADCVDPYWIALPLKLRNAVSNFEPAWMCWDPAQKTKWVRNPPSLAITTPSQLPFFREGMEFEEFVPAFSAWYSDGAATASVVAIRSDESLNRFRAIVHGSKQKDTDRQWVTWQTGACFNAYPIYDWRTRDIWIYHARSQRPYNRVYDLMHRAGVSIHQQRICQPYGDDQRRGLWLYHALEPETWGRVVNRVNGANQGALYAKENGNITGQIKITKPNHLSWQQFSERLLDSTPPATREHYRNKIAVFLKWYEDRGYPNGIPDEGSATDRNAPSWTRICKALLRNDYWCKGLSFSQTRSDSYDRYRKIMKRKRQQWGMA